MKAPTSHTIALALLVAGSAGGWAAAQSATTWTVDPVHSSATFTATHLMISHVSGTIPIASASIVTPAGATIPISAQAQLDLQKIDTHNDRRDNDLRSPHFFDVANFPQMAFTSTGVNATDAKNFVMTGNLTMHGVTKPVTLNGQYLGSGPGVRPGEKRIAYIADATIDRTQWGMTYGYPVASNTIDIHLELEAYNRQ
jgi:polyisoprenoid-binding protein YceI